MLNVVTTIGCVGLLAFLEFSGFVINRTTKRACRYSRSDLYINQHGHLPGIPSAEQVTKEGLDLVKMNTLLLEKVEELTLYSIQLEKTAQHLLKKDKKQQLEIDELKRLMKSVLQKR